MTQTRRSLMLQNQTDAQLRLALLVGGLDDDERRSIYDEIERRRSEKREAQEASREVEQQQAVAAVLTSFSDMSHAELLAWTQSLIEEENRAMAKELRARIKALEDKLAEVRYGELTLPDVEHPSIDVE
jgi:hypothetical protein